MLTQIVITYTGTNYSYSIDGATAVTGTGNVALPWFYMNDAKQQFLNHSISVKWHGMTGAGSYTPKQTLGSDVDAAPALGTLRAIATASNITDIDKNNFINELCTGASVNITRGTITAGTITVTILIDDIVNK